MSTIQTARYEQSIKRLLRLVGGGIMPRLQNDLSPVLNIEDPADKALLFWKGHKLAAGFAAITAAAGEFPSCSLFNPLNSGKLIVLTQVMVRGAGNFVSASFSQTRTLNPAATVSFTDTRASLTAVPAGEMGGDSFVAVPAFFYRTVIQLVEQEFPLRVVLHPGVGLFLSEATATGTLAASFQWLERSAETPELEV